MFTGWALTGRAGTAAVRCVGSAAGGVASAAVPGTNFVDPLGGIEPSATDAETAAAPQDGDPSAANGSDAG